MRRMTARLEAAEAQAAAQIATTRGGLDKDLSVISFDEFDQAEWERLPPGATETGARFDAEAGRLVFHPDDDATKAVVEFHRDLGLLPDGID